MKAWLPIIIFALQMVATVASLMVIGYLIGAVLIAPFFGVK